MTRGHFKVFTIVVFLLTAGGIGALVFLPRDFFTPKDKEVQQTKVVIPQTVGTREFADGQQDQGDGEIQALRLSLDEGESPVAALTRDFDGDSFEEQIIAYHRLQEIDAPIFVTYAEFDSNQGIYRRRWNAPAAVTRPGTLILYNEDLIGDGGICVLAAGMNGAGEQTLTVFRKNDLSRAEPFSKIAEFLIEGSITVEEPDSRNRGRSLSIATYGRDYESANIIDQIEVTYTYNQVNGLYEQSRVVKIPGAQIEQRRLRELLNGDPSQFESFIDGLWYQGEGKQKKYVHFNAADRELIFYNNQSEEVFNWQDSTPTRFGLHINSRNVSLATLRRTVNVELAGLESIRLRVYQDVYLRSGPNTIWDGSYQRVQAAETLLDIRKTAPYLNGSFKGPDGTITFYLNGSYELTPFAGPPELSRRGQYVFFNAGEEELLELRHENRTENQETEGLDRETFRVTRNGETPETVTLTRVRISTRGMQDMHEPAIVLTGN
jgi:PAS domain-containing protein